DIADDGTRYAEVRWAPSLHVDRGLSLNDGIDAVVRGANGAAARRGLVVRLIAVALRTHPAEVADEVAEAASAFLDDGITGFDIAGVEAEAPDPTAFASAVEIARAGGLGISCHAGEWGGAAQVRAALAVSPQRIAHGAPAADDPELMRVLRERDVTLDLCPTSNLQIGVGSETVDAPLPRLLAAGVPVTINTDDRTVSDLTLVREMERTVTQLGLSTDDIVTCQRRAYAVAFLHHDEDIRSGLSGRFEHWISEHPAPVESGAG
ncbi:MAG: adenosine deaminase family protein, partial [Miltoncostaeaceae bacterium]